MRGTKVQRDTVTAEGKKREDTLKRSYISNICMFNRTTATFFIQINSFQSGQNCVGKAATEKLREENRKQEPEETLFASLPPCLKLSVSAVGAEGIPLAENGSLNDTSLCFAELLLLISPLISCANTNVCIHICFYTCANSCTPTHFLTVAY